MLAELADVVGAKLDDTPQDRVRRQGLVDQLQALAARLAD
jgi:hypothetical protein